MKKWIGLLALTIALGLWVCCSAMADSDFVVENGVLTAYTGTAADVVIPGDLGVRVIGPHAFENNTTLQTVALPLNVREIGAHAFRSCTQLKSINFPAQLTKLGEYAFADCRALTAADLQYYVRDIPFSCFFGCTSLTDVKLPDYIESIQMSAFGGCTRLTSVTLKPSISFIANTAFPSSLTHVYCTNGSYAHQWVLQRNAAGMNIMVVSLFPYVIQNGVLQEYNGLGGDVVLPADKGITAIGSEAFLRNPVVTRVTVPEGVTQVSSSAFLECPNLREIIMPSTLTAVDAHAINDCPALESVVFQPGITQLTNECIYRCPLLSTAPGFVEIPDTVTQLDMPFAYSGKVRVRCNLGSYAHQWCIETNRTAILLDAEIDHQTLVSYTGTRKTLWIPEELQLTAIGDNAFAGNESVRHIHLPDGITSIGKEAFKECRQLQDIALPATLTNIGESAFVSCSALEEMIFPSGVTSLPLQCVSFCSSLSYVYLPDTLTSIGDLAFRWCTNLTDLALPDSLTHLGASVFASSGLTSLEFPDSLDTIPGGTFFGCSDLSNVRVPDSVQSIGDHAFDIYNPENLLFSCNASSYAAEWAIAHNFRVIPLDMMIVNGVLTEYTGYASEVIIPAGLGVTAIGDEAFADCHVRYVEIPEGVTSIGHYAFQASPYLESVSLPDSLTSMGRCAFMGCTSLAAISFPAGLTEIPQMAFYNCVSLTAATFPNGNVPIVNNAFEGCPENVLTFYCNSDESSVAEYAWSHHFLVFVFTPFVNADFVLPQGLLTVGEEAFMGLPVISVKCNTDLQTIGPRAFAGCVRMRYIIIPSSVTSIAPDAFAGCDKRLVIIGVPNSSAEGFASAQGYRFLHD